MNVLLVTGQLAKEIVECYARKSKVNAKVIALKASVAALLTPKYILERLKGIDLSNIDVILVPGMIRGDVSVITEGLGIPTFKGPRYAADLPVVLDNIKRLNLSVITPACDVLRDELKNRAIQEFEAIERDREVLLKNPGNILVGGLAIGKNFPMRVMAEIIDAPLMSNDEIQRTAKRYVELGADIIDIGMIESESRPLDARRAVKAVKEVVDVPVSIDTLDPKEMKEAVSAGADLILSVEAGNVEEIASFASKVAVVIIPMDYRRDLFPKGVEERINLLEENIKKARELGLLRIVGDLILDPMNIVESFIAYHDFAKRNPSIPLLLGIGNVTELIDADSVGINALLATMASEIGVSILLTTEGSDKTKGSISEASIASKMMFLAKRRCSVPKDLGIDLLILKDKRIREEPYDKTIELKAKLITAVEEPKRVPLDPRGLFKIMVDREDRAIVAVHFPDVKAKEPTVVIKGGTAEGIYAKILEMGLIGRLDHAAYIGSELAKAEIALRIGKEYIQDSKLFGACQRL